MTSINMNEANLMERVALFEDGHLSDAQTLTLFQDLVVSGDAWTLPGYYGRHAKRLLEAGRIKPRHEIEKGH